MLSHLRSSRSNRSGGSRSTSVSLGSSVTTLSLGTRLTISTLRVEDKRGHESTQVFLSFSFYLT